MKPPVAMTIAGVDSSGGAGVAADLAAFAAQGVWGACAITAVTAQNSTSVDAVELLSLDVVVTQIEAVCSDMHVGAVKTGMLGSSRMIDAVAGALPFGIPLVVDPVMVATTGDALIDGECDYGALLAKATIVTPNAHETEVLTGIALDDEDAIVRAARALLEFGCHAALVKGGHVGNGPARDCLLLAGQPGPIWLEAERVAGDDTHGTGCVLSASIAAGLAHGDDITSACRRGKAAVTEAIRRRVKLGKGIAAANPTGLRSA
ncbi:MAG TPA: bifunctional hydroxymethylpyrimidine kinase/phosphomethylpyrimidine kinase [Acidimicrobiales bacterium]|nr:bifunctional hydroxymethylpyrimidine kinase/phosphomethylpyrimidine kinase [Acidimicrobiales bacterium]